jgi:hypothetical protein
MKLGIKPKESPIHEDKPGKGKTGRVNASELLLEAPSPLIVGIMDNKDDNIASIGTGNLRVLYEDTKTPEYREHPPQSQLGSAERDNPDEVWHEPTIQTSSPTARKGQPLSGNRMLQKANAAGRKTTGNHNRADRVYTQLERVLTWSRKLCQQQQ